MCMLGMLVNIWNFQLVNIVATLENNWDLMGNNLEMMVNISYWLLVYVVEMKENSLEMLENSSVM